MIKHKLLECEKCSMKKILFVCTGNICRSAMAEGYLKKRINELGKKLEYDICSCGIKAIDGESATKYATEVMKLYEVDISEHKAQNISQYDLKTIDYIIVMAQEHKDYVIDNNPDIVDIKDKVYVLKEFANTTSYVDTDDPWGLDIKVYNNCAKEIIENIDLLLTKNKI